MVRDGVAPAVAGGVGLAQGDRRVSPCGYRPARFDHNGVVGVLRPNAGARPGFHLALDGDGVAAWVLARRRGVAQADAIGSTGNHPLHINRHGVDVRGRGYSYRILA